MWVHVGDCIYRMCLWEPEFNLICHSSGAILFSKTRSHWDLGLMDSSRQVSQWAPGICSSPPLHYWNYKPKTPHEAFWCVLWGLTHQLTNWTTPQSSTPLSYALEQSLRALNFVFKSLNSQGLFLTLRTIQPLEQPFRSRQDLNYCCIELLSKLNCHHLQFSSACLPEIITGGLADCWHFLLERGRRWGGP